ncbi:hypothetical protein BH20ACI3_BH20ACI3_23480 [soil metagenome]
MKEDPRDLVTPREYNYWKLIYRELALLPEWIELDAEARAQKLHERIEAKLHEADTLPQLKVLFECTPVERLKTVSKMIEYFEK